MEITINIDASKTMNDFLAESMGIHKYDYIMKRVKEVDVSTNEEFQKTFNSFYAVRCNAEWRKIYYELFEKMRKRESKDVTFSEIIDALFDKTGRVEASFSSKMLATLRDDMPIWDKNVITTLKLKHTGKDKEERVENAKELYNDMVNWYEHYIDTPNGKECINAFNNKFPQYNTISDIKKIDFLLWSEGSVAQQKRSEGY